MSTLPVKKSMSLKDILVNLEEHNILWAYFTPFDLWDNATRTTCFIAIGTVYV
jgi:hypothetical protein